MKLMKLRSKKLFRSNSKLEENHAADPAVVSDIKWELRPGGMLVQKRDGADAGERPITVRASTVSKSHDISVPPTSTFGEMKQLLSIVTKLEVEEQRLIFKGKEREDYEFLHMVGVRDGDKVVLLQDPAIRERKLLMGSAAGKVTASPYRTITV